MLDIPDKDAGARALPLLMEGDFGNRLKLMFRVECGITCGSRVITCDHMDHHVESQAVQSST